MNRRPLWVLVFAVVACSVSSTRYTESRPSELTGRWVLSHADGTWGDTTTWNSDGGMLGSTNHPVPIDARWVVRTADDGTRAICISGGNQSNCQPFVINGDTLIWGLGAQIDRFRHIPGQ
jgi:hypothetical protein